MAKRFLTTLTNNLGFKVLAVFLACILWLVVYNLDDPNKTKNFSTNVTITNADVLTNMNMCYEVLDNTNTVTFSVTAKKSYIDNLEDLNFSAVADMKNIVIDEDQTTASVPIEITSNNYNRYITVNGKTKYLKVALDDLMAKQFVVIADTSGKVSEGSAIGEVTVTNPTVIKVSGPKSIVSKIDKAVATIDVNDMSVTLSDNVVPVFYDKKEREIDTTRLTLSSPTVTVVAKILNTKKVPLDLATTGSPARNYTVTEISADPSKIEIKGASGILNPITSIEIPKEVLNVQGASSDIETTIDVTEYLPEGVELVDSSQRTIKVTVRIEGYISKTYSVPVSNLKIEGVGENLHADFGQKNILVSVSGMQSDLEELDVSMITGAVDVTGLKAGTHKVEVVFELQEKYTVKKCKATVTIKDVSQNTTESSSDQKEDTSQNSQSQGSGDADSLDKNTQADSEETAQ